MRRTLEGLAPYRPPESEGRPLHRNTNRWGAHSVWRRLAELAADLDLSAYPDASASDVREALAARYELPSDWFVVGNGSNEVFDMLMKTLLDPGELVLHPSPSYGMYAHYALANAASVDDVELNGDFDLEAPPFVERNPALIVLCSPNNPTGNVLNPDAVRALLEADPDRPVIVDEAYAEFASQSWLARVPDYPNLIVVRTMSKAFGLAGLRLGYAAAHPKILAYVERARLPYNVNALTQTLAAAALREPQFADDYVAHIRRERPRWAEALDRRGFRVWPSEANFLLAGVPEGIEREDLMADLHEAGLLIRAPGSHPRLADDVRITVGTPDDREALLAALDEVLP